MERATDFQRLLQHQNTLSTANRLLRLRLGHLAGSARNLLLPQQVCGNEAICGGIEYRISCLAASPALPLKELIALPAEIQFVTDRGCLRRVCGIVTDARAGNFDGGLAAYHLVVRDALAIMEKRTNTRIFRDQSEIDIVQTLFDEWRQSNAVLASAFDYELHPLFAARQFPAREQTMQHNETDAGFVRRLLKRRGVSWYVRPGRRLDSGIDPGRDGEPAHTVVLFNDAALSLPQNAADVVRYHPADAAGQRDTITSWTATRTLQPGSITRHSWDYKNPLGAQFMTVAVRGSADQGNHGNQLAASLDDYLVQMPHAGNDVEDHWRLGQLRMDRHSFEAKCFHGEGSVRDFCAGEYFTLSGHPEIDSHPAHEREFIITELDVTLRNNLPGDLTARAQRLFAHDGVDVEREGPVQIGFTAVRRGVPIVPAYDPRRDLPQAQLQSAIVVGPPAEEVHCDALGRVKIRFPGMRAADQQHVDGAGAADRSGDSAWVRVTSNWAGNGPGRQQQCGTLSLPRVGSEVLVTFLGGDPDRPIILSQLFNQRGQPPAFSNTGDLPGNRHLSGTRSREAGGRRGNQLRFDDTRGEISSQLSSDHGASQLNLGWLAQPRAEGCGAARGEGAELRSDNAVAIRGGQGVLVSADAGPETEGAQLERARLLGLAEVMQGLVDELARLAKEHAGDEATPGLAALTEKLKRWDLGANAAAGPGADSGGAAIVAMTAPDGMLLASADSLALGSEKKINVASVGDIEVVAGRNIFLRAARGISAFAHRLGIKLVAGRANVSLQAHHGNVEIRSSGRITLISAQGIDLQAPQVRVVANAAQTEWGRDTIVHQCSGRQIHKAADVVHVGPGAGASASLNLPSTKARTDERVVLRHEQTGEPVRNQRYIARFCNGDTVDGVTDDAGRTSLAVSDAMGSVEFEFLPEEPRP